MRAGSGANIIRTLMPPVITAEQLEEGLAILESAIAETSWPRRLARKNT